MFTALTRVIWIVIGMIATSVGLRAQPENKSTLVSQLEATGYFEGMAQTQADKVRQSILNYGWTRRHTFDESKMVAADSEAIAEGGFFELASELQPILGKNGVAPITGEQDADRNGYWVKIDGEKRFLYTGAELNAESEGKPGLVQGLASARSLKIINERLAAAGSDRRAYAMSGGEELIVAVLTEQQANLIAGVADPLARPYEMTEDYPLFGMSK